MKRPRPWELLLALTFFVLALFVADRALACEGPVYPTEVIHERLAGTYGETIVARGLSRQGFVTSIHQNADTGTYTIVLNMPTGMSCLIDAGTGFDVREAARPGEDL